MPIDLVPVLLSAAIRACVLGAIAFAALRLLRVRSAAAQHATWTAVLLGMLFQCALGPAVPGVRLRILPATPASVPRAAEQLPPAPLASGAVPPAIRRSAPPRPRLSPVGVLTGVYLAVAMLLLARMALGWRGLRRILRDARPLSELGPAFLESASLVVPASVGCFQPKILLPPGWNRWDASKLQAVIAHETAHARRRDWLVGLAAHLNLCVFWFHPLAWWLNRELACLAEEACDDIALSELADRDQYAATLVEFARVAAAGGGRLSWGAVSMAKESTVSRRLNRILDWRVPAAKPFGRMAWSALLAGSLPLIYLSAAVRLAPAQGNAAPPAGRSLSLCVVVDNSGSMFGKEREAKAAALAVLRAAQPGDEVCVVDFNDDAFLDADLSTEFRKATEALQRVEARGGSALRDAIQMSTDLLQQKAHNRKVLVLVTDGDDTSSTSTEEQLREKLKTSGVLVSSIALRDGQGWRALSELAALTGGVLYHPLAPAEVENGASAIMRDARSK